MPKLKASTNKINHLQEKSSKSGKIYLDGKVKIIRKPVANNTGFNIATDLLIVEPDLKFAKTASPITIVQKNNIIKAVGAELDLKTGTLKLLSKFKGQYRID